MSKFLDRLKSKGLSPSTIEKYVQILKEVGPHRIVEEAQKLAASGASSGTVLPIRSVAKHYLISEKGIDPDRAEEMLPSTTGLSSRMPLALTEGQLRLFVSAVESDIEEPMKSLLLLLPETGLKLREVLALATDDLVTRPGTRQLYLIIRGRLARFVPLSSFGEQILKAHLETQKPEKWMFDNITEEKIRENTRYISKHYRELQGLTPSALRRTFAANQLRAGISLDDLQKIMGHRHAANAGRYLQSLG